MIDLANLAHQWMVQQNLGRVASPLVGPILQPNPRRYAIDFVYSAPGGGANPDDEIVILWPGNNVLVSGYFLSQYRNLHLDYKDYGPIVQLQWWAQSVKGIGGNVSSIELIQVANQED